MPKFAKPFYRSARKCWFVQIGKEQIKLHPDEKEAFRLYHELMADRGKPQPTAPIRPGTPPVAEVLDKFLDWCKAHRASRTFDFYHDLIQSFLDSLPDAALPVGDLKPFHVIEWVDRHPDWSQMSKRQAMVAIQRPLNWAEELGHIPVSPIKRLKKPQPQHRDNPMTPQDFADLLKLVKDADPFRDLLLFSWHSGCRPQEARHIERRHINLAGESVVIPQEEAKGKRQPRLILLHGPALEIAARLIRAYPEGKLFRNARGRPWTKDAICCRFGRMKTRLGKRFAMYDARHGFCQRLLESGANHLAVAELMGHSNARMVTSVYSHMNRANAHLKETLKKAASA